MFKGGMSKRPVEIGTGAFIFNGICAKGFSLGTWIMENDVEKVAKMFAELQELILNGKLCPPPAKIVPMQKYTEAIENAICKKKIIRLF
jgi:NADPH:quinone reductase-like Zn-dependent oxidoreductase